MYKGREGRPLTRQKEAFARESKDAVLAQRAGRDLLKAVRSIRPCSLVGAAARGGAFSEEILRALKEVCWVYPSSNLPGCSIAAKLDSQVMHAEKLLAGKLSARQGQSADFSEITQWAD